MVKKRRKKAKVSKKATAQKPKMKKVFLKPEGIRAEDIKPYTFFRFTMDGKDEIHYSLPNRFGYSGALYTLMLSSNGVECLKQDQIPCRVSWEYKIEILKEHCFRLEALHEKYATKLFKKRSKS